MMRTLLSKFAAVILSGTFLVSCDRARQVGPENEQPVASAPRKTTGQSVVDQASPYQWPPSLKVLGDGYPAPGAACRRLGETSATVNFLDHEASLIGCPSQRDAALLPGQVVGEVDGVVLISVRDARPGDGDGQGDALVAGTDFNATADIPCAGYRRNPPGRCKAGIRRGGGIDLSIIEITWPDGGSRALFFRPDGTLLTANTAQADGSAKYTPIATMTGDLIIVTIGPERYEIPEVFLKGD